jgi:TnpA family transposase
VTLQENDFKNGFRERPFLGAPILAAWSPATVLENLRFREESAMPHRCILTPSERNTLLAFPSERSELIRLYTFSEQDLSVINQRRGDANRLGFAILMCGLRYPGRALTAGELPPNALLTMVARQLGLDPNVWGQYAEREETRREHLSELRIFLGLTPFGLKQFHQSSRWLAERALQTDKGIVLGADSQSLP